MAKTNPATTNTKTSAAKAPVADVSTTVEAKGPNKMQRAKVVFDEIMALPDDKLEGKTRRRIFMDRAVAELEMKGPGANTYFQNLKNEAETGTRYAYSPASKAAAGASEKGQAPSTPLEVSQAEQIDKLTTKVTVLNRTMNKVLKTVESLAAHA